jgi:type I site-specific restriction endonuclease
MNEADTCRKYVLPKLYAAAWTDEQINEQRTFTDGRIIIAGKPTVELSSTSGNTVTTGACSAR